MTTMTAPRRRSASLAGWRVALRMASRDVRTSKGRSALVVLLIGLPVVVLVAGLVLAMTAYQDDTEALPGRLGGTQASIDQVTPGRVEQYASGMEYSETGKSLPGLRPDAGAEQTAAAVAPLLPGAHLVPLGEVQALLHGSSVSGGPAVAIRPEDAARPALAPMLRLVSGRFPKGPDEIAVTTVGIARGLPESGTVSGRIDRATQRELTVVGVVDSPGRATAVVDLAAAPGARGRVLVDRPNPVTWDDVKRLNQYGLVVTSRAVVTNPPPEYLRNGPGTAEAAFATLAAAALAGVLLEMCLLAGPAFAIGAMRQRRSLALAASNGATRAQLRKLVLGQALVLGTATAVLSAVAGVLVAVATVHVLDATRPDLGLRLPVDVPWVYVLCVTLAAGLACVIAALVPARGLGRLDVVSVLRGSSVSPKAHRGLPVLGLVLAAIGGVLVVWPIVQRRSDDWATLSIVAGAFLLVIGAILLVPMILAVTGRLTSSLPVAARMATRDATRQRGRAVPTVASLIGGAALAASVGTAIASGMAADERDYRPTVPAGWASVSGDGMTSGQAWDETMAARNAGTIAATVAAAVPSVQIHTVSTAGDGLSYSTTPVDSATQYAVLRPGCDLARVRQLTSPDGTASDPTRLATCIATTTDGPVNIDYSDGGGLAPEVRVVEPDLARILYGLDDASVAALARGEILADGPSGTTTWVVARTTGMTSSAPRTAWSAGGTLTVRSAPSLAHPAPRYEIAPQARTTLLSPATARRLGWMTVPTVTLLSKPGGFSAADERTAQSKANDLGIGGIDVERGYRSPYLAIVAVLFGTVALLSVVAVVVATALSVGEARRDLETLAAVGASRWTRRRFAASQAAFLAVVGTLLGFLVGLVPGIAMCWPVSVRPTRQTDMTSAVAPMSGVIIRIPWEAMGLMLLGVCLLSALVASLLVGRERPLSRRTA